MDVAGEFGLLRCRKRAGDDSIAGIERHLACRDVAEVSRGTLIYLMAYYKEADCAVRGGGAEVDRLNPNLIEVAAAEPPILRLPFAKRTPEQFLSHEPIKVRTACLQAQHVTRATGHDEQVTSALTPYLRGTILNGHLVPGAHQGSNVWQIGEEFGRPG